MAVQYRINTLALNIKSILTLLKSLKFGLLVFSISGFIQVALCQEDKIPKINFIGINFSMNMPQGDLRAHSGTYIPGFELHYYRQFRESSPFFWGVSTYYFNIGRREAVLTEFIDNTIADFRYRTVSNVWGFNGAGRVYPDLYLWKMEFYAELLFGGKWFFTNTSKTMIDTEDSDLRMERGRFALDYGLAVGMNIPVSGILYINTKASYLPGNATSYYARNDKAFIEFTTLEGFDLKNSSTEIFRFDLGVTFAF
jgi:hypothetical protein